MSFKYLTRFSTVRKRVRNTQVVCDMHLKFHGQVQHDQIRGSHALDRLARVCNRILLESILSAKLELRSTALVRVSCGK